MLLILLTIGVSIIVRKGLSVRLRNRFWFFVWMFLCVQETIGLRMFSFEAESICVHDCLVGIGGCVAGGGECVCVWEREREREREENGETTMPEWFVFAWYWERKREMFGVCVIASSFHSSSLLKTTEEPTFSFLVFTTFSRIYRGGTS